MSKLEPVGIVTPEQAKGAVKILETEQRNAWNLAVQMAKESQQEFVVEYTIPGMYRRPGGIIKTKEE